MLDGDTGEEREMKTPTFIPSGEIPRGLRFRNRRFEHDSGFVHELNAEGMKDMGRAMAALKERFAGTMDFSKASAKIKELLSVKK